MKKMTLDLHDYIEDGSVFKRSAVRGIIQKDKNYLLIIKRETMVMKNLLEDEGIL